MTTDYRAQAYTWAGPGNQKLVDAVAAHLHYNESLHLHNLGEEREQHGQCSQCWYRAGLAVQAVAALGAVTLPQTSPAAAAANPLTDQYLAAVASDSYRHQWCPPGGCAVERLESDWRTRLLATLSDIDPATTGKVLLHLGANVTDVLNQRVLMVMPTIVPHYMANLLKNLGADLINQNTGTDTVETPADGA